MKRLFLLAGMIAALVFPAHDLAAQERLQQADGWQYETILDHYGIGCDADVVIDSTGGTHVCFQSEHNYLPGSNLRYAYKASDTQPWEVTYADRIDYEFVGEHCEIVLDSMQRPHVSYILEYDFEYIRYLKYAHFDGATWQTYQLTSWDEYVNSGTAIAVDANDLPHLAYGDSSVGLKHKWHDGSTIQTELVATGIVDYPQIVIGDDGDIYIACFQRKWYNKPYKVALAHHDGSAWTTMMIDNDPDLYALPGLEITLDGVGYPHVVYTCYHADNRKLVHSWEDASGWHTEYLEQGPDHTIWYPAIAIGADGAIHVSYAMSVNNDRVLMLQTNAGSGWESTLIEENGTQFDCLDTSCAVDPFGRIHIAYYNLNNGHTRHAWRTGGLISDTGAASAAAGVAAGFTLEAGVEYADRPYILTGSTSGTLPGTALPGGLAVIPLNRDFFTNYILDRLNTPRFVDFKGDLDGDGNGSATLDLGPIPSSWVGTTMWFAFATRSPYDFASNPVEIRIEP